MARPDIYFHGTNSIRAVEAFVSGEPLRNVGTAQPRRSRMRGADPGLVHLSPCLMVAARYSKAVGRLDRPSGDISDWRAVGVILAFEPDPSAILLPDEDELGWAVRIAAEARAFGCGPRRFLDRMPWNEKFAASLAGQTDLVAALEREAAERLPGAALKLANPQIGATAAGVARLGRTMRDRMSPELAEAVVRAGVSVATPEEPLPFAAWEWDSLSSSRAGLGLPRDLDAMLPHARELSLPSPSPGSGIRR